MNDTMHEFATAFKILKTDTSHRLKTGYSYDIKDDNMYKHTQKIEKRMRSYYARQQQIQDPQQKKA